MKPTYTLLALATIALSSCSITPTTVEQELFDTMEVAEATSTLELTVEEQELFDMVNAYRNSIGLDALVFSPESQKYALEHNKYMIAQGKLSHDHFNNRATKVSRVTAAKYVAENVARNYDVLEDALLGWLDSEAHKNTIEGDFTHATLSITKDADGNPYYTQIFFSR